jgi:hypothetical protein
MQHSRKQQGWAGLIALLFALVIVGLMARTVLKEYGFYSPALNRSDPGARGDRSSATTGRADEAGAAGAVSPQDAMARVRRLGDTVREQAQEIDQRIENATGK